MSIKWEEIRICNSALSNEIYLAKLDKEGIAKDKSNDRTEEIQAVLMSYLDRWCKEHKVNGVEITCQGGTLTWKSASNYKE